MLSVHLAPEERLAVVDVHVLYAEALLVCAPGHDSEALLPVRMADVVLTDTPHQAKLDPDVRPVVIGVVL